MYANKPIFLVKLLLHVEWTRWYSLFMFIITKLFKNETIPYTYNKYTYTHNVFMGVSRIYWRHTWIYMYIYNRLIHKYIIFYSQHFDKTGWLPVWRVKTKKKKRENESTTQIHLHINRYNNNTDKTFKEKNEEKKPLPLRHKTRQKNWIYIKNMVG